jgi:hypothetical protein
MLFVHRLLIFTIVSLLFTAGHASALSRLADKESLTGSLGLSVSKLAGQVILPPAVFQLQKIVSPMTMALFRNGT